MRIVLFTMCVFVLKVSGRALDEQHDRNVDFLTNFKNDFDNFERNKRRPRKLQRLSFKNATEITDPARQLHNFSQLLQTTKTLNEQLDVFGGNTRENAFKALKSGDRSLIDSARFSNIRGNNHISFASSLSGTTGSSTMNLGSVGTLSSGVGHTTIDSALTRNIGRNHVTVNSLNVSNIGENHYNQDSENVLNVGSNHAGLRTKNTIKVGNNISSIDVDGSVLEGNNISVHKSNRDSVKGNNIQIGSSEDQKYLNFARTEGGKQRKIRKFITDEDSRGINLGKYNLEK